MKNIAIIALVALTMVLATKRAHGETEGSRLLCSPETFDLASGWMQHKTFPILWRLQSSPERYKPSQLTREEQKGWAALAHINFLLSADKRFQNAAAQAYRKLQQGRPSKAESEHLSAMQDSLRSISPSRDQCLSRAILRRSVRHILFAARKCRELHTKEFRFQLTAEKGRLRYLGIVGVDKPATAKCLEAAIAQVGTVSTRRRTDIEVAVSPGPVAVPDIAAQTD